MTEVPDPIVVRIDPKTRRVLTNYIGVIVVLMVTLAGVSQTRLVRRQPTPTFALFMAVSTLLGSAMLILRVQHSRVVLDGDWLDVSRWPWASTRILQADVVARYFSPAGYRKPGFHVLILRNQDEVRLPPYLEPNAAFRAWLNQIPRVSDGGRRPRMLASGGKG